MRRTTWSRPALGMPALLALPGVAASCGDGLTGREAAAPRPQAASSSPSLEEAAVPAGASPASAPSDSGAPVPSGQEGFLTVMRELYPSWERRFNPLLGPGITRWPTTAGIYEPLIVFNTMRDDYTPWLSTGYTWSDGNRRLTFTLRPGVTWSDGRPFTATDVAFTFELLKKHSALDMHEVWTFVASVHARDDVTVEFVLQRPFVPGLAAIGHQPIVPEHIWKDVADPVTFDNEHPVATGPFTEVKVFTDKLYELGRNPRYWQPGRPAIAGLRFPAYPDVEAMNSALLRGEVDWAGNFVADIQRTFVDKDPAHHRYWFPLVGGTVLLYPNVTRKPLDDVRVRKALSMALDRDRMAQQSMSGHSRAADATGLSDAHVRWRSLQAVAAGDWVKLDVARASALLDEAGYVVGKDGLRAKGGAPLRLDLHVVDGWGDWIHAGKLAVQQMRRLGVDATLKVMAFLDYFDALQRGNFDLSMSWAEASADLYHLYHHFMGSEGVKPVGELAQVNWHRYGSKAADRLLRALESTSDPAQRKRIAGDLQMLFVKTAPAIPLFLSPSFGEYNTRRFIGFPGPENPYAKLSPNNPPECLLVLTELRPRPAP
ncbi:MULTISPECIES: ABC transporter substrate-binding protein [Sorangium]|uniref:ABC transporter substrate-binding protein n=1 Tax=Sorangium TaxID=39643 RepID=UPI003D9C4268